ncbi:MAG: hypothetical protein GY943_32735, partial [Chloroflexi bacterium]|nr:hypothetical protein [Chloroflexota bacterium]
RSITAVYPTLSDILAVWKRTQAETVALVAEMPPEFVAKKASYRNVGENLIGPVGLTYHTRGHFNQIREAIESARTKTE